jgi:Tol biopolymer transport system component
MRKHVMLLPALVFVIGLMTCNSQAETTRVSIASSGIEANNVSKNPSISKDGRYVAFSSDASNLVAGDANGEPDIFVHNRNAGDTTRVNVTSSGIEANNDSSASSISADGRYVAFESDANNLVAGDANGTSDIFVHDRSTGDTTRVSVASSGIEANDYSYHPSISADGRCVAFSSSASNLVTGDTNGRPDIFIHDRKTGKTTRVSVTSSGIETKSDSYDPSISADGRCVAFESTASNLVTGDTNGSTDIFIHDRNTGETARVSVASSGIEANHHNADPSISADGRYVAFSSSASNLVAGDTNGRTDIFIHDRNTGETTRVSVASSGIEANDNSFDPSISADGRYLAFVSYAGNLVAGDANGESDIFVHDRNTGETARVSVASSGIEANDYSSDPSISADGRYLAFQSGASNLVAEDTNEETDIFVNDLAPHTFVVNNPTSMDNGINDDGKSSVTILWMDSTSSDVDHYEIVAKVGAEPSATDTVAGCTSIEPGTQTAAFDWNAGDLVYVGVVAVNTKGFRKVCFNRTTPSVQVVADGTTTTSVASTTSTGATTTLPNQTFSLSGSITGVIRAEVQVVLSGTDAQRVTTDPNGDYEFTGLASGYYIVTPAREGYAFEPASREIPLLVSDISGLDFVSRRAGRCAVAKLYGEDSWEVELLRNIRDEILVTTPEGREIIRLYYGWSPVIVEMMDDDESFKAQVKELADEIITLVGGTE